MIDAPSVLLAFAAGVVSFLSPCSLPLVPGYLAIVTGRLPGAAAQGPLDARVVARAGAFVGTFSLIFIVLGLSATAAGQVLAAHQTTLNRVAGLLVAGMGALFVASVFVARLNRDLRPAGLVARAAGGSPVVAGAAFAVAWTPCVGPTLGAILGLAATQSGVAAGGGLLAVYAAGLAVPFLVCAVAFDGASRALAVLTRHWGAVQLTAGIALLTMGVLVFTGQLFRLNVEAQKLLSGLGLDFWQYL